MTDDSLAVTSERLAHVAGLYFDHLGATVETTGDRWHVEFPEDSVPEFLSDEVDGRTVEITVSTDPEDGDQESSSTFRLAPQTDFTRQLIDAAGAVAPVGTASLTAEEVDLSTAIPDWLAATPATVADVTFRPYFDATLVTVWVRVEIETPSQYQREHLYRITVDPETGETVEDSFGAIDATLGVSAGVDAATVSESVAAAGEVAGEAAVEAAREEIESVRTAAAETAGAAFDDYRQRLEARIERLQTELDAVDDELSTIGDDLAASPPRAERLQLLERREELQRDREDLSEELSTVRAEKSGGFRDKRAELAERHTVSVSTRPVAATVLSLERGDLEVLLEEQETSDTLRLSFGLGDGIRGAPACPACDRQFSTDNCPRVGTDGVACDRCRSGD